MKNILITGLNSYIGNSLEEWLSQYPDDYKVDKISLRDDKWKDVDFSKYDSIVHTAGLAHIKETKKNRDLYFKINRDLTIELADKAKSDGVNQFIFLSTMSVYGMLIGVITAETAPNPTNAYGQSKYEAELYLQSIENENFKVAIVRPPMVYGPNCKGNYQLLRNFSIKIPIFPNYSNKRSMIYINNLCISLMQLLNLNISGTELPQNIEYVSTSEMVKYISLENNKKIYFVSLFNPLIKLMLRFDIVSKVFGDLYYAYEDSIEISNRTNFVNFITSIEESEIIQ